MYLTADERTELRTIGQTLRVKPTIILDSGNRVFEGELGFERLLEDGRFFQPADVEQIRQEFKEAAQQQLEADRHRLPERQTDPSIPDADADVNRARADEV